jgi:uncharacterized protein (DUF58 family)
MLPAEVVLGARQIYILPTRHGLMFALVLLALLLGAVNYGNALAYLLAFLLASMAVVSILHTQRNLLKLRVTLAPGEPVFAGEPAAFRVCLHNEGRARYALKIETRRAAKPAFDLATPEAALPTFDVPARDTRCVTLTLPAPRRGWLEGPALVFATIYPLGINRAWSRRVQLPARVLVYPRPAEEAELATAAGPDGESHPGLTQDGEDFAGLRRYQPGDTLARISWKTYARGQGLHTKDFRAPLAESLWLDWETFAPHDGETRLSLLTRALLDAEAAGLTYGLRLPGLTLEPDSGAEHRHRCLEALALYETGV